MSEDLIERLVTDLIEVRSFIPRRCWVELMSA